MTQPQDPRKAPLQDDEIALARVLRALPSGEPPEALDTAILRAATDAVSPGRRTPARGLRWLPTWAIGTAAAAVLAVGVGIQLRPPLAPQYPAAGVQEQAPPLPQARERMDIELVEPDQALAPPPASAPPEPRRTGRPAPPPPPPAPAAVPAPPPAVMPAPAAPMAPPAESAAEDAAVAQENVGTLDTIDVTGSRLRQEATDQARRTHQESYARRARAQAQAKAEQSARSAESAQAERAVAGASMAQALDDAEAAPVAAAPAGPDAFADAPSAAPALPPVAEDAALAPAAWFERIRERRRQGDIAGARASLHLFVQAYPDAPLPGDLARLR
jgi:hypothetical protein